METVVRINDAVNSFAWGTFGLILLLGTGFICTVASGFFQITNIKHWISKTFGVIKGEGAVINDAGALSQFRAFCTAMSATIGTGNIAGVSTAICVGGAGAVFWMWIAALFGMMIKYSENVLGVYYRRRSAEGAWSGGPMYYLQDGLSFFKGGKGIGRVLAVLFCIFTMLASFGVGNTSQINKITLNVQSAFFADLNMGQFLGVSVVNWAIGIALTLTGAVIILGGFKRLAIVSEKLVPFMTVVYIAGCLLVIVLHIRALPEAFASIFKYAFGPGALAGGAAGTAVQVAFNTIKSGCKRGVFSNEAGLGSSVIAHSATCAREPVRQGLWGIAEVFYDTFVICTMTALVVLTSGAIDLSTGSALPGTDDATLVAGAFRSCLGRPGEWFVVFAVVLFAFTTVMGWSYYGSKAAEYIFGVNFARFYRVFFVMMIIVGAVIESSLAWDISDTFNGLMMVPNLIGILILTPLVVRLTRNYKARKLKGEDIKPMLSYDPDLQRDAAAAVEKGLS